MGNLPSLPPKTYLSPTPVREPNSLRKQESCWLGRFLGDSGLQDWVRDAVRTCVSLIPKPLALSQPLLGFSPNDHIFAKNWALRSNGSGYLKFRLPWIRDPARPALPASPVCSVVLAARPWRWSRAFGVCIPPPPWLEGKLGRAQTTYTSSDRRISVPAWVREVAGRSLRWS